MSSNATIGKCYSGQINLAWKASMQPKIALSTLGHSLSWPLVFTKAWEEGWGTAAGRNNIIPTVSLGCSGTLQPWTGPRVEFPVHIPRGTFSCPSWLLAPVLGLRDCFFGVIHHGPLFSISSFPRWLLTVYYQGNLGARLLKQIRAGQGMQEEEIRAGPPGWPGVEKEELLFCLGTVAVGKQHRVGRSARHGLGLSISPRQGGTQNLSKPAAEATKEKSLKGSKE